jgi:hypothetical protein
VLFQTSIQCLHGGQVCINTNTVDAAWGGTHVKGFVAVTKY